MAFRHQNVGATTQGGLVKSFTHYSLIDGGSLTAPDNAVFDSIKNEWVAENTGVAPDIAFRQDARSLINEHTQLDRALQEALKMLECNKRKPITPPQFPPRTKKGN